jgi:hypothetical protein
VIGVVSRFAAMAAVTAALIVCCCAVDRVVLGIETVIVLIDRVLRREVVVEARRLRMSVRSGRR